MKEYRFQSRNLHLLYWEGKPKVRPRKCSLCSQGFARHAEPIILYWPHWSFSFCSFLFDNSELKLKENLEESKLCSIATRCTEEGSMKEKQFRPLDIVINRRKLHEKLHSARAGKKRKGFEGILVGKSTSHYHFTPCTEVWSPGFLLG